jgi:hypothetical protein
MRVGKENKRQVYLLSALCVVIVVIAGVELRSTFAAQSNTVTPMATRNPVAAQHKTDLAGSLSNAGMEPRLRIGELARNELVVYSATGRNIFSVESKPVHIERPIAPARPDPVAVVPAPPPMPPKPPEIDLKYLGYTEGNDKIYNAILVRGDDSLTARSGEVIFHRYRVGPIRPASVQITDLTYNNTQTINITEK